MENPKHNPQTLDFYEMNGWFEYFRSSAAAAGGCDILCAGRLLHWKAAIGFVAATFAAADETGNPRFEKILAIVTGDPSGFENQTRLKEEFLTEVLDCVTNGYAALDIQIDRTSVEQSLRRIDIRLADQHQLSTLVEIIESSPPSSAIFIGNAELFSASVLRSNTSTPFENVRLEEDFWVQDVYHAAKVLAEVAERRQLYILLFVQRFGPARKKNNELLKSIENVAFVTVNPTDEESKDDEILIKNATRWRQLAKEQKLDEIISEIDGEPLTPINRALLKAQYLMTADQPLLGFTVVQPFLDTIRENSTVHLKLTVAQLANRAGQYTTSLELLRHAIQSSSSTEHELSNALNLARSLAANDEIKIIVERLIGSYPGSTTTAYERLRLCKDPGEFAQLAKDLLPLTTVTDRSEDIYFVYLLASKFGVQEIPDYRQVVEDITLVAPAFRSNAILACATRALKQRLFYTVIDLTLNEEPINNREAVARYLISVLEGIFVSKSVAEVENVSQNEEAVQRCLIFILKYLGANPLDGDIRAALYRILSPETSGMNGMAHLAHIIIDAPAHTILSDNPTPAIPDLLTPDQLEHSFETVASKLSQPIILGTGRFPGVEPVISLDSFLQSIVVLLQSASINKIVDEHDVQFVHLLLHLAILASRYAKKEEEYGPKAIRIAAAGLAASGHYQSARNFAELCLQLASESSDYHKRASWLAYADIYSRCYNLVDALIGMAIAVNIGVDSDTPDNRYDYLIVTCRIVRDLTLFPLAMRFVRSARELVAQTASPEYALARVNYLEASIEFQMINWESVTAEDLAAIKDLTTKIVELNRRARSNGLEVLPTVLLLAQMNGLLSWHSYSVEPDAVQELADSINLVTEGQAKLLQAFATGDKAAETIQALSLNLSRTRYTEDYGTDVNVIALLARRVLKITANSGNVIETLFLLEWLTNLSLNTPESDQFTSSAETRLVEHVFRTSTERAVQRAYTNQQQELEKLSELAMQSDPSLKVSSRYPDSAEALGEYLRQISNEGIDVHSLGLSDDGSLVRVRAQAGTISLSIESEDVFDAAAYHSWAKRFPYQYRCFHTSARFGLNEVEQSMARIGITGESSGRPMLLIPDVRLQGIPPNLLLVNGRIAGFDFPIGVAPSLSWLKGIRSTEYVATRYRTAWIPVPDDEPILQMLAEDLAQPLADYKFVVSHDRLMPSEMRNSDIAVIGAHGGLQEGNEWFRVVTDDRSTRFSARDIATRLRGCGVVILFVCSGGRIDQHPFASAGVGLSQLLLDHGCRTVLASPWPVQVTVAAHWLPAFLEAYVQGQAVIEANYLANKNVTTRLNPHPMLSLAMNVFGDPLTRIKS